MHESYNYGGADSASTAQIAPTLDGLTPVTFDCHTANERMDISTIPSRIAFVSMAIERIGSDDRFLRTSGV